MARYRSDGQPDTTFDGDGKLTTDPMGGRAEAFAVVVQPDGKTVVAAHNYLDGQFDPFYLVRYNVDGSLDPTFGINGEVFNYFGAVDTGAYALALQKDGDLIAAGHAQAARYRWDGSLDAGGIVDVQFDPGATNSVVRALTVQHDGKLIAGGSVYHGAFYGNDMALARFICRRSGGRSRLPRRPQTGRGSTVRCRGRCRRASHCR